MTATESDKYYKYFDKKTKKGVVFDEDLSNLKELPVKKLTQGEITARKKWEEVRKKIRKKYKKKKKPSVQTTAELLEQRILAPSLTTDSASTRSKPAESRKGRRYPPEIFPWDGFREDVKNFVPEDKTIEFEIPPFTLCSNLGDPALEFRDENQEHMFLVNFLNQVLHEVGLMGQIVSSGGNVVGQPDAFVANVNGDSDDSDDASDDDSNDDSDDDTPGGGGASDDDSNDQGTKRKDIGTICEFKSTHNLPLPMKAANVCAVYNESYSTVYTKREGRTKKWSRVCHPIDQLLGYMVDNKKRYGVLSSGTRTYFLKIDNTGGDEKVMISDAFFVGEKGYLKAWVYTCKLTSGTDLDSSKLAWKMTNKTKKTPPKKSSRKQPGRDVKNSNKLNENNSNKRPRTGGMTTTATTLPLVPFSEVKIVGSLGEGRRGTVFLAKWEGMRVALKQFDVDKSGCAFEQEVEAYMAVRDCWGKLVPTPFFVSQSWSGGTQFLALQVGREPGPGDDTSNWRDILDTLENEYGIRHEDCDGFQNLLFIPEGDKEILVAADLEDVTWMNQ